MAILVYYSDNQVIMTKHEYLTLKQMGNLRILYNYYVEHFNSTKYSRCLFEEEFQMYIRMWANPLNNLFTKVCNYYDAKFSVTTVYDKTGQPIGYV
jgi:hypothetical protein